MPRQHEVQSHLYKTCIPTIHLRGSSISLSTPFTNSSFSNTRISFAEYLVKMATQRALLVQEIGKPLVLAEDRPILEPGTGQIQIKVTVAGESDRRRSQRMHQSSTIRQPTSC